MLQDRESGDELDASDDDVAKDLDLHSLIISSLQQEPMFTAEQVLEEIEEIMQVYFQYVFQLQNNNYVYCKTFFCV